MCSFSYIRGKYKNPLQDVKKGLENLITFCKKFSLTVLEKSLVRQEQFHENYRKTNYTKIVSEGVQPK